MLTYCRTVSMTTTPTDRPNRVRAHWTPTAQMARSLSVDPACDSNTIDSESYYSGLISSACSCIAVAPSIATSTLPPIASTFTSGSASTTSVGKARIIGFFETYDECRDDCARLVINPPQYVNYSSICSDIVATTLKFVDESYVVP